jgi:hypothetical protein
VAGNLTNDGVADINRSGTEITAFPAPPVRTVEACAAAHEVAAGAGVTPRDEVDRYYLSALSLPPCRDSNESTL